MALYIDGGEAEKGEAGDSPGPTEKARRKALWLAVLVNLSFLGFFKYFNFFVQSFIGLSSSLGLELSAPLLQILLPVGISFYTFQITSYTVDVYRRDTAAESSFSNLLLFTTYFPQLVAGPIERAGRLLPRFNNLRVTADGVYTGLQLAAWGIFKKVFIADNLSEFVDILLVPGIAPPVFAYSLAAIVFALQIYADFSGYTDVARGVSRMLGVDLVLNFNLPFLASNPSDFWRRWHITLGAFLRDYLYIPLGGNRQGALRQSLNLMIVWTLGGLWHGASVGFLVWGLYCGLLVVLYLWTMPLWNYLSDLHPAMDRTLMYLGRVYTFLTFGHGLLLFRVESIDHLRAVIYNLRIDPAMGTLSPDIIWQILFFAAPLILMQIYQTFKGELEVIGDWSPLTRGIVYGVGLSLFITFGAFNGAQFFYFQF